MVFPKPNQAVFEPKPNQTQSGLSDYKTDLFFQHSFSHVLRGMMGTLDQKMLLHVILVRMHKQPSALFGLEDLL